MAEARAFVTFLILVYTALVHTEVLTPRYFNLASKKKITATATCGDEGPELYCKLVGANADHDEHVIQGQVRLFIFLCVNGCLVPVFLGFSYPKIKYSVLRREVLCLLRNFASVFLFLVTLLWSFVQ